MSEPLILGLACLLLCALERLLLGSMFFAPLSGLACAIYLLKRLQLDAARDRAQQQRRAEALAALQFARWAPPVREGGVCLTHLFAVLWPHFISEKFKRKLLTLVQTAIEEKVPEKYAMEVREMRMGGGMPVVREISLCPGPGGEMEAMDMSVFYESEDLLISLAARTPVGTAVIKVESLRLSGTMRIIPVPSENLLAWSFVGPPDLELGFTASVGGVKISQFNFLNRAVVEVLRQQVTEPRRKIWGLYLDDAPATVRFKSCAVHAAVHSLHGDLIAGAHEQAVVHVQMRQVQQSSPALDVSPFSASQVACAPDSVPLHTFSVKLEQYSAPLVFKVCAPQGQELGQAVLNLKFLRDGSLAMWAISADGGILARRWRSGAAPWQVDLPLELFVWKDGEPSAAKFASLISPPSQAQVLLREPIGARPAPTPKQPQPSKRKLIKAKLLSLRTSLASNRGAQGGGASPAASHHNLSVSTSRSTLDELHPFPGESGLLGASETLSELSDNGSVFVARPSSQPRASFKQRLGSLFSRGGGWSPRASPSVSIFRDRSGSSRGDEAGASRRLRGPPPPRSSLLRWSGSNELDAPPTPGAPSPGSAAAKRFQWMDSKASSLGAKRNRSLLPAARAHQACIRVTVWCDQLVVFRPNLGAIPDRTPGDRAVIINVVSAAALSGDSNGTRDPYVKLRYGNRRIQTSVLYQTCDPVWQDTWVIPENPYVVGNTLHFEVYDKNYRNSVLIGKCKLSVDGLTERDVHAHTLPLSGANAGSLSVEVAVCPGDVDSALVQQTLSQLSKNVLRPDKFKVVVERARNLVASDFHFRGSSSDPYIRVAHGSQSHVTPTIYRSLNPEWHAHFEFDIEPGQLLQLTCYDRDKMNSDEFLGSVSIDMDCLQRDFQGWVRLSGVRSGDVFLRVFQSRSASPPSSAAPADERALGHVTILRRSDPDQLVMTSRGPLPPDQDAPDVNSFLLSPEPPPGGRGAAAPPAHGGGPAVTPEAEVALPSAMAALEGAYARDAESADGEGGGAGGSPRRSSAATFHPWLLSDDALVRRRGGPSRLAALFGRREAPPVVDGSGGGVVAVPRPGGRTSWRRLWLKGNSGLSEARRAADHSPGSPSA